MKKFITIVIVTMVLLIGNSNLVNATHFAGADLTYKCLGGSSYLVTLTYYRDCSGLPHHRTATIHFSCSSNPAYNFDIELDSLTNNGKEITYSCSTQPTSCKTGRSNSNGIYGIEEYIYQGVVNLPPCNDWSMYWSSNDRNQITTVSGQPSWYIPAQLNNLDAPCNNSPTFSNKPVSVTCMGQNFTYNHGAQDLDGDSLSYSFYTPYISGPNPLLSLTYISPFTSSNFLPSSTGITLDSITGNISFTPSQVLNTATGIKVDEWREIGGVMKKIGSIYRDMQLNIIACNNTLPVLSGIDTSLSATYSSTDTVYYKEICLSNDSIKFHINGFDSDTYDPNRSGNTELFSIEWDHGIADANFSIHGNGTDSAFGEFTWLPNSNDISTVPKCFTASISDQACIYNGIQTFSYCLVVKGMLVELGSDTILCNGEEIIVKANTDTTTVNYNWKMNGLTTGTPLNQDSIIINSSTLTEGNNILSIETNDGNTTIACPGKDQINIKVIHQPEINGLLSDTAFCSPGHVTYDAGHGTLYNWKDINGTSISQSQTFSINNSGIYSITVDGGVNSRCNDSDTFRVIAITKPEKYSDTCIWLNNAPYILNIDKEAPYIASELIYNWNTNNANDTTSTIYITQSGTYTVSVSHPYISTAVNCTSTSVINIIDQDNIIEGIPYLSTKDSPLPGAEWTSGDQEVCANQKVKLRAPTAPNGELYNYIWKEDEKTISATQSCFFLKDKNGIYNFTLNVGGCQDNININVINCAIEVPNIITPNGDGKNDYFKIMLVGDNHEEFFTTFPNSKVIINNRWGKTIFESNNYQNNWQGENLTDGVYYWILELADGNNTEMNGTVTIIRK